MVDKIVKFIDNSNPSYNPNLITLLADSREKKWVWGFGEYEVNVEKRALKTGDYTILGYENDIVIDRKKSPSEIAQNFTGKDYIRFQKELIRMQSFKEAYFLLEFTLDDLLKYPEGTDIPFKKRRFVKRKGASLWKQMNTIQEKYGVTFIFGVDRFNCQTLAIELFNKFLEKYGPPCPVV